MSTRHGSHRHIETHWRQALRARLTRLDSLPQELLRIEEELAQLLADEALASGLTEQTPEAIAEWLEPRDERLNKLIQELQRSLPRRTPDAEVHPGVVEGSSTFAALSGLPADVRLAFRSFAKKPGLTAVILATLFLGIGLNATVFSVLDSVLFRPLAVEQSEQLLRFYSSVPNGFLKEGPVSLPDLKDLGAAEGVAEVAAHALTFTAMAIDERAEIVIAEMVTENMFDLLGVRPLLGRLFQSSQMKGREHDVVVLSTATWQRRFESDPDVLGRVIRVNGHPLEIIGVAPGNFRGLIRGLQPEIWMPLETALRIGASPNANSGAVTEDSLFNDRSRRSVFGVARLASGATVESATGELQNLAIALQADYPNSNEERTLEAVPFSQVKVLPAFDGDIRRASAVIIGLVFLVLLIACANLANLLLARALSRRGEMATRLSLGASRSRIVRQLLVESLLLAGVGVLGGLTVAYLSSEAISRTRFALWIPVQMAVDLDLRAVAFTAILGSFTALVFGLFPALEASRTDLTIVMRESAGRGGGKRLRFQSTMVVAQVAFSMVLLIFAGLALRSVMHAAQVDIGFQTAGAAGITLSPASQGYSETEVTAFYDRLAERLANSPGVAAVSNADHIPLTLFIDTSSMVPTRRAGEDPLEWPEVDTASTDEHYFNALKISILRGRTFLRSEIEGDASVIVINQELADQFWPKQDPVGKRVLLSQTGEPFEVIGVVGNGKYRTLGEAQRPFAYFPLDEQTSMRTVTVRFDRLDQARPELLERAVQEIDPDLAYLASGSLEDMIGVSIMLPRLAAVVFGALGAIGLLLSAMGLFGVLAYAVGQRTHEIGLRVAMGASTRNVLTLVARGGLTLVGLGIMIGATVALGATRLLSAMLYGVSATDAVTFVGVSVLLLAVALLATLAPARIALAVSPTEALRYD